MSTELLSLWGPRVALSFSPPLSSSQPQICHEVDEEEGGGRGRSVSTFGGKQAGKFWKVGGGLALVGDTLLSVYHNSVRKRGLEGGEKNQHLSKKISSAGQIWQTRLIEASLRPPSLGLSSLLSAWERGRGRS